MIPRWLPAWKHRQVCLMGQKYSCQWLNPICRWTWVLFPLRHLVDFWSSISFLLFFCYLHWGEKASSCRCERNQLKVFLPGHSTKGGAEVTDNEDWCKSPGESEKKRGRELEFKHVHLNFIKFPNPGFCRHVANVRSDCQVSSVILVCAKQVFYIDNTEGLQSC